ncbi:SgcJ/EcaC family oxidoreductase [Lysobacter sp. BMK333-48F3]|uniref:SgcJ/EcaC family oxidoreductase n=1 Tax=Lysobacter sp. BMK333-48F3 TaxID=2867962 RepID=UPI001C8BF38B|nr:SgcJ/EcaC family oxidoreductase [Lysobacter sp. BMK333-48F3]MBX9400895.1 SgcJ/EcaC family oxidoreductase [Lysobacter sp. BMK333-48F3]
MKAAVVPVIALVGIAWAAAVPAYAAAPQAAACAKVDESQVAALFDRWNGSLRTGDPDKVVANYAPDGVLLATVSNQPRTTPAAMRDYFVKFLKDKPVGTIDSRTVKIGCNVVQDIGTYTFRFASGKLVHARYTYVYEWENGKWLIAHHHSSAMPEPVRSATADKGDKRNVYDSGR